ncbi:unnamed protein product [Arctia plantaginis]|uniref:Chitinase n=1 Tax=Arctia plantaginis TaxID=874455 RepID=A0A8S0Z678_ARCPL|nr:unnamed protein product [Arctia plantaginis]
MILFLFQDVTIWLSVLLAVITLGTPVSSSEPRVVCYYTNWSVYRPGTARFNPQNINPYLCTHLIYAFGGFTKDNSLKPFDKYQDIEKGGYAKFTGLKTYNKNLKTLLAIGGWNEGSTRFSSMVASRERRKEFVRNAIKFLRQNRFDGLDLDWEYPAFRDGGKPKDKEHYARFVKELREEFETESEKTGKPRLLLTMAVPAGIEYIQKGFDVKTLNKYLDWMNLLTYDYHSAFEPAVNHHAPLYANEEPNEYSVDSELNIDYTIKFYLEQGADADKLVLGIPTYGRSYTLFNPDAVELGSPADGPGEQGDATREKGPGSDEDSEEYEDEKEQPWTVMYPNAAAMGPVAYRGNQWVGYDDEDIVRKKAEYVVDHKLGGIMFWSIDNDDFRGTCHGKPYPLIEAAKASYYAKLGSTINTVAQSTLSTPARPSAKRKQRPRITSTTTTTTTSTTTTTTPRPSARPSPKPSANTYNFRVTSTTPVWTFNTPEPPTTPDPGSDFKCVDEGFFPHPRDCKKYFWCLDSGPSNLGIVAHQFTCPSGLYFNKAADSCDFSRNVLCKITTPTTKAPTAAPAPAPSTTTTTTARTTITTRKAFLSTKNSVLFRTTSSSTTTTPKPKVEEYDEEVISDEDAEDPKVIKELIDLIKKVGGIEQLEKQLHRSESSSSVTDGVITTTPSSFNKKLYQKVLDRTRGQNKFTGKNNNAIEPLTQNVQNSRRGPQNAGLEPSNERDTPLRKDRPQYVTINRQRGSTSTTAAPADSDEDYEEVEDDKGDQSVKVQPLEERKNVATTAKALQYVNIRRGRPNTLSPSDTADDTASRNALFERQTSVSAISETANIVDAVSSRREVKPEYVTIRRQRPTTEETTTQQYQQYEEEEDTQTTLLEREISTQLKYNTIVRSQTTLPPEEPSTRPPLFKIYTLQTDTPSTPESTPMLAVQIASLLHSLNSSGIEDSDIETEAPVAETDEPTTISTTTSTATTTTTGAPPLRRTTATRRRGVTIKTTPVPSSTTQVSPRNYTIVRRRRPLRGPNEITSGSDDSNDSSRKIRSTTPDSREISGVNETVPRRFRDRFQGTRFRVDDSIPAAASPILSGQLSSNDDEEVSVQVDPKFVPRQRFNLRTDRRFPRPSTSSGVDSDTVPDSDVSAATVEARRPGLVTRGRNRFTLSSTTEATFRSTIAATLTPRRPTFGRFSPRPFTRPPPSPADINEDVTIEAVTQRSTLRLPLSRTRPAPAVVGRKLPFPSRQSTTQQVLLNSDNDDDELETRADDILLSESAREEKEHNESEPDVGEELPKRRVVIKKLRPTTSTPPNVVIATEIVPIDTDNADTGKRRFRVIRRRPTSSTTTEEPFVSAAPPTGPGLQRIRKVIRKKLRPTEIEPVITVKTSDSLNIFKSSNTEVFNYGEKTKPPLTTTLTEAETEPVIEEVTEFYKEEKKVVTTTVAQNIEDDTEVVTQEPEIEKIIERIKEEQVPNIAVETTTITNNNTDSNQSTVETSENIEVKADVVTVDISNNEQTIDVGTKPVEEIKNVTSANDEKNNDESKPEIKIENKVEVAIATDEQGIDISDDKETDTESLVTETTIPETTTTSTTVSTTTTRSRLPYRPRKKLFTPSTESSLPSTSKTFSRKYNPGVYTSPATVDRPQFKPSGAVTRRPFSSRIFTRRPFTTKTTQKVEEDEEYNDEEVEEHEQENPFVFVPPNQLFTRKPESTEEDDEADNSEELLEEGEGDENYDEEDEQDSPKFPLTTRKPGFRPRVVNSSTFRTSTTTTELPKPIATSQNRTGIITRFGSNKPVTDKKRVQNIPSGYNNPVNAVKPKGGIFLVNKTESTILQNSAKGTTTGASVTENESSTADDDYLTATLTTITDEKETTVSSDISTINSIGTETVTDEMEIDDNTDDYLEFSERTTNYPTTQDMTTFTQTEPQFKTTLIYNTVTNTIPNTEAAVEQDSTFITTTAAPLATPVVKTQFNKLFSISRVVEVNSKLDKHHLKNNQTTLIEEGQIMVEKKPVVDKIGEVSRYSLIKIVEDEIPIYLTKFGHIYPVEHPPDNIIRIDEARNARTLNGNAHDVPKENLVASESVNEGYRHIKDVSDSKDQEQKTHIVHVPNDQFLSYVNDDNKNIKDWGNPTLDQWQFVPAAYENEKVKAAKNFEIITPRTMNTNPSTLSLEGLFKTDSPEINKKASNEQNKSFFVYSPSTINPKENIGKLPVLQPANGPTIITFTKGQELSRASVTKEITQKDLSNGPIYTGNYISSTLSTPLTTFFDISPITITVTEKATSPILDLLTTTVSTNDVTTITTESPITIETTVDDTTTTKISPLDTKRAKFPFARRPIIKSSNFTRPSIAPRTAKKINATVISNLSQKTNKTSFSPSKSRFSATRAQNVPVDLKRKSSSSKVVPRTFSTNKVYTSETLRTTERKLYFKPNRPSVRPSFFPRKTTPTVTTGDT